MTKQFKPLYKKTKTGAIQEWKISVTQEQLFDIENGDGVIYTCPGEYGYLIEFGQVGGEIQKKFNPTKGKNIGKSNETTPLQQAELEAMSRWLKQLDKGYVVDIENDEPAILPMLAHKYYEHTEKVKYPCFVQPKLNGLRCLAILNDKTVDLISRKGKKFYGLEHIENELAENFGPDIILDGELYIHGVPLQKIRSLTAKFYEDETPDVEYHIYDIIKKNESFNSRWYDGIYETWPDTSKVVPVLTYEVENVDELYEFHSIFKGNGYEGSIIRNPNGLYEMNTRSYNLLKMKDFLDEEFEIIGAEENKNSPGQCSFILQTKEGNIFKSKPEGDTEYRESVWRDHKSLIGKMATVRFFEYTPDGVPFHSVVECIRDYE